MKRLVFVSLVLACSVVFGQAPCRVPPQRPVHPEPDPCIYTEPWVVQDLIQLFRVRFKPVIIVEPEILVMPTKVHQPCPPSEKKKLVFPPGSVYTTPVTGGQSGKFGK